MTVIAVKNSIEAIIAANGPVLLLDTCSLLDLVRAPIRKEVGIQDISAAHELLDRAQPNPAQISILIDEQVQTEFSQHINEVVEETEKELSNQSNGQKLF